MIIKKNNIIDSVTLDTTNINKIELTENILRGDFECYYTDTDNNASIDLYIDGRFFTRTEFNESYDEITRYLEIPNVAFIELRQLCLNNKISLILKNIQSFSFNIFAMPDDPIPIEINPFRWDIMEIRGNGRGLVLPDFLDKYDDYFYSSDSKFTLRNSEIEPPEASDLYYIKIYLLEF